MLLEGLFTLAIGINGFKLVSRKCDMQLVKYLKISRAPVRGDDKDNSKIIFFISQ